MLHLPDTLESSFDMVTLGRRDPDQKGAKFAFTSSTVTDAAFSPTARWTSAAATAVFRVLW